MTVKPKRQIPKSFGSSDYGYKAPTNPMIPLSAEYQVLVMVLILDGNYDHVGQAICDYARSNEMT